MKQNSYCTYFDYEFCPYGLSLIESLLEHDPYGHLFILCLDLDTFKVCSNSNFENITLINLQTLEDAFPDLIEAKSNRTITEYYWTLTPCFLYYLIFQTQTCCTLTYLDADQFFYSDPQPVFKEIGEAHIAIMPHRFPDQLSELKTHGEYNVSWLTFRNTQEAKSCLYWWMSSCIEWCYAKVDGSRYGDQKYLDQFPSKFQGVHEIQHKGCGLAPWNLSSFNYDCEIILFHFQSLRIHSPHLFAVVIQLFENCDLQSFQNKILKQYINKLKQVIKNINIRKPSNKSDKSMLISKDTILIIAMLGRLFFLQNNFLKSLFLNFTKFSNKSIPKQS